MRPRSLLILSLTALLAVSIGTARAGTDPAPAPAPAPPPESRLDAITRRAKELAERLREQTSAEADRAAAWIDANVSEARVREAVEKARAYAEGKYNTARATADERYQRELGLRFFNAQPLSLGNPAWSRVAAGQPFPHVATLASDAPLVLLVHGLDEPGDIWNDLVPALTTVGFRVARFDYPNDGPIAPSADALAAALRDLRTMGVARLDIVAYSMGGLVSRDTLTRPEHYAGRASGHDTLPDIERLVMIATPHTGSSWAHLEALSELRDQFQRWMDAEDSDLGHLVGFLSDGRGQAADDLLPGSEFLAALNARPAPAGVRLTSIVGRAVPLNAAEARELLDHPIVRAVLTDDEISAVAKEAERLSDSFGDGPVSAESAALPGSTVVHVEGAHSAMIRSITITNLARTALTRDLPEPPAVPAVLEALKR